VKINPQIAQWLASSPFERWGYFPIDAVGPNDQLTAVLADTIKGYDRALCYSSWAKRFVSHPDLEAIPHGIDTAVFKPRDKAEARQHFRNLGFAGLSDDSLLIGIVATNQARKDYGLGIAACAKLLRTEMNLDLRVWIHVDTMKRYWDLVALLEDFGLLGRVVVTTNNFTDEQMSWLYSACDVTLGIGLGEGFGYPIFESLACGVPVVHGDYGGAAEHLEKRHLVRDCAWRLEGQFNCMRPVYSSEAWAAAVISVAHTPAALPDYLDWETLWPRWEKWLTGKKQ
jgi:glycosyltransferase involved in cell wall biosynthesis